jgi:hypothetical protein
MEPTHSDILEKLGELKGQVTALIALMTRHQDQMSSLAGRVGALEIRMAQGVILCAVIGLIAPLVIPSLGRVVFNEMHPAIVRPK